MNKYKIGDIFIDEKRDECLVCSLNKFNDGKPIYYSPFVLLQYFNKKCIHCYHSEIDITYSHQVKNQFNEFCDLNRVPKYIANAFEEEKDFIYDDESAYTKVTYCGFIFINMFMYYMKPLKNVNYFSYYTDDEDVRYFSQVKDKVGNDLSLKYHYASLKVGLKWMKVIHQTLNLLDVCKTSISKILSDDVCNHILSDYIQYSDLIKLNSTKRLENVDITSITNDELDKYEWICYLHYYCLIDKVEKIEKQSFYCKDGLTLGFPIYYSKDKKYRKAEVLFCDRNDHSIVYLRMPEITNIQNLKLYLYNKRF